MKKTALFALALLAAPVVAMATPEIAVHQTPAPTATIAIPQRFAVVYVLPVQAVLESMSSPRVRVTVPIRIRTALALRSGEIVRLKIVPRGRP
ncbi:hypothetical protein A9R16_006885 [Acidiferrobacter thiooxydans]|jgi:hypothetical protein|uniref:hypothetical protein n=1 Tax=Acidiferrobacter thiooxydans TaxID=163359 RepID=UPI0008266561|nr:hypothetical protein [Acidiferrobacter thiooxydans]UEO01114.1 hypothetical protein A9R16_006885 [Acidiferrobacter thiooxydans]